MHDNYQLEIQLVISSKKIASKDLQERLRLDLAIKPILVQDLLERSSSLFITFLGTLLWSFWVFGLAKSTVVRFLALENHSNLNSRSPFDLNALKERLTHIAQSFDDGL